MPSNVEARSSHHALARSLVGLHGNTAEGRAAHDLSNRRTALRQTKITTENLENLKNEFRNPETNHRIQNTDINALVGKIKKRWVEHPGPPPTAGYEPFTTHGTVTETTIRTLGERAQRVARADSFTTLNAPDRAAVRNQVIRAITHSPHTESLTPAERRVAADQLLQNHFHELRQNVVKAFQRLGSDEIDTKLKESFKKRIQEETEEAKLRDARNGKETILTQLRQRQDSFNDTVTPGAAGWEINDLEAQIAVLETPAVGQPNAGIRDTSYRERLGNRKERADARIGTLSTEINNNPGPGAGTPRRAALAQRRLLIEESEELARQIAAYDTLDKRRKRLIHERDGDEADRRPSLQKRIADAETEFHTAEIAFREKEVDRLEARATYEENVLKQDDQERSIPEHLSMIFDDAATEFLRDQVADTVAGREASINQAIQQEKDELRQHMWTAIDKRWLSRKRAPLRGHVRQDFRFNKRLIRRDFRHLLLNGPEQTIRDILRSERVPNATIDRMLADNDVHKELDQQIVQRILVDRVLMGDKISDGEGQRLIHAEWFDAQTQAALLGDRSIRKKLEKRFNDLKEQGVIKKHERFNPKWAAYIIGTLGLTAVGTLYGGPLGILPTVTAVNAALSNVQPSAKGAEAGAALGVGLSAGAELAQRLYKKSKKLGRNRHHGGH